MPEFVVIVEDKLEGWGGKKTLICRWLWLSWDTLTLGNNGPEPLTLLIQVSKHQCLFMRQIS